MMVDANMRFLAPILLFAIAGCGYQLVPVNPDARFLGTGTMVSQIPGMGHLQQPAISVPPAPLPANTTAMSEQMAFMSQKLATLEDDKKVLTARIVQLESQLREKDRALTQA